MPVVGAAFRSTCTAIVDLTFANNRVTGGGLLLYPIARLADADQTSACRSTSTRTRPASSTASRCTAASGTNSGRRPSGRRAAPGRRWTGGSASASGSPSTGSSAPSTSSSISRARSRPPTTTSSRLATTTAHWACRSSFNPYVTLFYNAARRLDRRARQDAATPIASTVGIVPTFAVKESPVPADVPDPDLGHGRSDGFLEPERRHDQRSAARPRHGAVRAQQRRHVLDRHCRRKWCLTRSSRSGWAVGTSRAASSTTTSYNDALLAAQVVHRRGRPSFPTPRRTSSSVRRLRLRVLSSRCGGGCLACHGLIDPADPGIETSASVPGQRMKQSRSKGSRP